MSTDGLALDPGLRGAANGVLRSSASPPGSDRFREQLRVQCAAAGFPLDDETLRAIDHAMVHGTFGQF